MTKYQSVKGMNDLFEEELRYYRRIEEVARAKCTLFGFSEIRTPILEELPLFLRGIGETTDIVEKEMYSFEDRDGKQLCLRPENTASVARALIQHKLLVQAGEEKLYYIGPMFRRERPQKGRYRQFHQFGAESIGNRHPSVDVELIALLRDFFVALGVRNLTMALNSLGTSEDSKVYTAKLNAFLDTVESELCENCSIRRHKNPLRVLDCKAAQCIEVRKKSPMPIDFLSNESKGYFDAVQSKAKEAGIDYVVDASLVRGLDYYSDTVFELWASDGLGAQNAVAAGGRYDGLFEQLGGVAVPGVGFSVGIERALLVIFRISHFF